MRCARWVFPVPYSPVRSTVKSSSAAWVKGLISRPSDGVPRSSSRTQIGGEGNGRPVESWIVGVIGGQMLDIKVPRQSRRDDGARLGALQAVVGKTEKAGRYRPCGEELLRKRAGPVE